MLLQPRFTQQSSMHSAASLCGLHKHLPGCCKMIVRVQETRPTSRLALAGPRVMSFQAVRAPIGFINAVFQPMLMPVCRGMSEDPCQVLTKGVEAG